MHKRHKEGEISQGFPGMSPEKQHSLTDTGNGDFLDVGQLKRGRGEGRNHLQQKAHGGCLGAGSAGDEVSGRTSLSGFQVKTTLENTQKYTGKKATGHESNADDVFNLNKAETVRRSVMRF